MINRGLKSTCPALKLLLRCPISEKRGDTTWGLQKDEKGLGLSIQLGL